MANLVYSEHPEALKIVSGLRDMYPEQFAHIDTTEIGVVMAVGAEKPKSWMFKVEGIKPHTAVYCKKRYIIYFLDVTWNILNENQKIAMLFKALTQIPDEFDGKVSPDDLKDCKKLVKAFGTDYMQSPGLPNLLKEKQII